LQGEDLHSGSSYLSKEACLTIGTESAVAGAAAGLVSAVVTCPLDVIKTKLQAGHAFNTSLGAQKTQGVAGKPLFNPLLHIV